MFIYSLIYLLIYFICRWLPGHPKLLPAGVCNQLHVHVPTALLLLAATGVQSLRRIPGPRPKAAVRTSRAKQSPRCRQNPRNSRCRQYTCDPPVQARLHSKRHKHVLADLQRPRASTSSDAPVHRPMPPRPFPTVPSLFEKPGAETTNAWCPGSPHRHV